MTNQGLVMHCYHDTLFEYVWDLEERIQYIKRYTLLQEQSLRLKLLALIPEDRIPGRDSSEWLAYDTARQASDTAWLGYVKAREAYLTRYQTELTALHQELCPDCPWDGLTIFTRKDENGIWY